MNKIKKKKTTLGQWITIFSFLALIFWVIINIMGRAKAEGGEKIIELEFGGEEKGKKVEDLNDSYIKSSTREDEFFEGAKCEQANLDCFTKIRQTSELVSWKAQLIGAPSDEEGENEGEATSLIKDSSKLFSLLYTPQASADFYVADLLDNMGIMTNAYAQGYGYHSLSPYLSIWRVFRNIAYACFTGIILVIGMMILFRQKFGGQASVTAQQALPRVVIALILVTFSYAIAGLLIDLMYWIMYAFTSFTSLDTGSTNLITAHFGNLAGYVLGGKFDEVFSSVNEVASSFYSNMLGNVAGSIFGWVSGIIGTFIIMIAMLFALFRLLFILLKSYAYVLLNIIFAPIILMAQAIPGINTFKKWLMSIIANLSPFVMVFFLLVVQGSMNKYFSQSDNISGFIPPYLIGVGNGASTKSIGTVIGLAILLALPEIVENIKKKLGGDGGFMGEMANTIMGSRGAGFVGRNVKGLAGAAAGVGTSVLGATAARYGGSGQPGDGASYFQDRWAGNMARGYREGTWAGAVKNPAFDYAKARLYDYQKIRTQATKVANDSSNEVLQKSANLWLSNYETYSKWNLAGRPSLANFRNTLRDK